MGDPVTSTEAEQGSTGLGKGRLCLGTVQKETSLKGLFLLLAEVYVTEIQLWFFIFIFFKSPAVFLLVQNRVFGRYLDSEKKSKQTEG